MLQEPKIEDGDVCLLTNLFEMSSSEEEDNSHLLDCIYEVKGASSSSEKPVSNRVLPDDNKDYDYKCLKVTKSYQSYVSKHLEALLDRTLFAKKKPKKRKISTSVDSVMLLSESNSTIDLTDVVVSNKKQKKLKSKKDVSEKELERRAREVAVTPDYILSQKEVKLWAPETKGIVENLTVNKKKK